MVSLPKGARESPAEVLVVVGLAVAFVAGAAGWSTAAGVAFAAGLGGALVVSVLWPDGFAKSDEPETTEEALETVRWRYASGEIDESEFERRLEALLETEAVEDASEYVARDVPPGGEETGLTSEQETTRETQRETSHERG
ncbi:hypothetical protein JCM17823_16650 [Halorubrum gandharaense]